jgi:RNA polymerase sigma factor (sigma-70 family)
VASHSPQSRVLQLLFDRQSAFRRTARRHSLCRQDADDAFQRAVEILLTKAPADAGPDHLTAWMQVVTRREALAVRRMRERLLGPAPADDRGAPLDRLSAHAPGPAERAEEHEDAVERLRLLGALKPQERRALVLKAHGYSYAEIAAICGWTYTKVNRCLAEGRARLRALAAR